MADKKRVFKLAEEIKVEAMEIIAYLKGEGIEGISAASYVDGEKVQDIKDHFSGKKTKKKVVKPEATAEAKPAAVEKVAVEKTVEIIKEIPPRGFQGCHPADCGPSSCGAGQGGRGTQGRADRNGKDARACAGACKVDRSEARRPSRTLIFKDSSSALSCGRSGVSPSAGSSVRAARIDASPFGSPIARFQAGCSYGAATGRCCSRFPASSACNRG